MQFNVIETTNGYLLYRERDGGLNKFEIEFDTYDKLMSFLVKLLEHDECITR